MSLGDSQNYINLFPKNPKEPFRFAVADGLIDFFVDLGNRPLCQSPAHLPLISFPGLTVLKSVVMYISSIQSTCSEKVLQTISTFMLLAIITVPNTTGSIVHIISLEFLVFHVVIVLNGLLCPSTPALDPEATLNMSTRFSVKMSTDSTPLWLYKADITSEAARDESFDTACNASVWTS
ncbi:hypothetical protein ACHAQI_009539 [Fusarium lateritium]